MILIQYFDFTSEPAQKSHSGGGRTGLESRASHSLGLRLIHTFVLQFMTSSI